MVVEFILYLVIDSGVDGLKRFSSDAKIIRQIRRRVTRFITAYQSP